MVEYYQTNSALLDIEVTYEIVEADKNEQRSNS